MIVYSMVSLEWTVEKFCWFYFVTFCTTLYFTYYGMMTVSITPNYQVAAIVASSFFTIWSLFVASSSRDQGFLGGGDWYYCICSEAWTMYGLMIGQYGDIERTLRVVSMSVEPMVKLFLQQHYRYDLNFKGPIAAVLIDFAVLFAFVYTYCIKTLNFQIR